nr:PepSY domain-containing protein [Paenibacillus phyllosphaerae]
MADETGIASIRKLESTTNGEPASGNDGTDPSAPSSEAPGNETAVPKPSEDPPSSVPSQTPSQQPSTEPTTTPSVLLTKDKAAELALKQVSGKVEDVDLEETGGNPYYLVEIDTPDGREAVVQLHAVSGEAMSVTWDDDEEDKSQDDDTD